MENNQNEQIKGIVLAEKPDMTFKDLEGTKIRVISNEDENYLDTKYDEMINFMRTKHSDSYTDEEKEDLYSQLQIMWNDVSGKGGGRLNETSFDLILHQKEFNMINDLLRNKIEYDVDTIFYAIELTDMLADFNEKSKYNNDKQGIGYRMTPVDLHYLYHLLAKQTVKGLSARSYLFAEVIKRIALSSNVFNYYKTKYDDLSKAIQFWVHSLDEGVNINETDKIYQIIWGDSDIKPKMVETTESK